MVCNQACRDCALTTRWRPTPARRRSFVAPPTARHNANVRAHGIRLARRAVNEIGERFHLLNAATRADQCA
jgi:hypothetical protein